MPRLGSPVTSTWLFPGLLPGRPLTAARLGERLRALGIHARPGRRAALTSLAAQLPAAVLAELLNLHPTTAVRWVRDTGGDWNRYPPNSPNNAITNHDEYPHPSPTPQHEFARLKHCRLPVSMTACRSTWCSV